MYGALDERHDVPGGDRKRARRGHGWGARRRGAEPRAAPHGDGPRGDRRGHGLRRRGDPEEERPAGDWMRGQLTSERAATDPKVFTKIHMQFTVRGRGLKRNVVEHAI